MNCIPWTEMKIYWYSDRMLFKIIWLGENNSIFVTTPPLIWIKGWLSRDWINIMWKDFIIFKKIRKALTITNRWSENSICCLYIYILREDDVKALNCTCFSFITKYRNISNISGFDNRKLVFDAKWITWEPIVSIVTNRKNLKEWKKNCWITELKFRWRIEFLM